MPPPPPPQLKVWPWSCIRVTCITEYQLIKLIAGLCQKALATVHMLKLFYL